MGCGEGIWEKTTAEFVENAATFSVLEKIQVDYAQGFLIGIPASADESPFSTLHLKV